MHDGPPEVAGESRRNPPRRRTGPVADAARSVAGDDAVRGILAHVDERYQTLNLRMERIETALRKLVQANRAVVRPPGADPSAALVARMDRLTRAIAKLAGHQRRAIADAEQRIRDAVAAAAARPAVPEHPSGPPDGPEPDGPEPNGFGDIEAGLAGMTGEADWWENAWAPDPDEAAEGRT